MKVDLFPLKCCQMVIIALEIERIKEMYSTDSLYSLYVYKKANAHPTQREPRIK